VAKTDGSVRPSLDQEDACDTNNERPLEVEEDAGRLEGAVGFSLVGERFVFRAYYQGIDLVYNAKSVGEWGPLANLLLDSPEVVLRLFYG